MADVKTNLRELSVGFYFFGDRTGNPSPDEFLSVCKNNIINCSWLEIGNIASNKQSFSYEEEQIIRNGLKLGKSIEDVFGLRGKPKVTWEGLKTQSGEAVDLIINNLRFSLKEDSHILENMGLYKLLNCIIGKDSYKQGLHVFEEFSPDRLNKWFETTRDLLLICDDLPFSTEGRDYESSANLDEDGTLHLIYHGQNDTVKSTVTDFAKCDYYRFEKSTTSKTREKAFSKWLKESVENLNEYKAAKKACAVEAGDKIVRLLSPYINTSPTSLLRLFRDNEYYYAKTTSSGVEIYQVPSKEKFASPVIIKNIVAKVPVHQLNIHTTLENQETHKTIEFRSELRYSHGQFNGTPEAKFYIASGDITAFYKRLYPN